MGKMAESIKTIFERKIKPSFNFEFDLKDQQGCVVKTILEKRHCVGVFPTGFGKSICFLLPPLISDLDSNIKHICIVISPLKSLMLNQCQHNSRHGISAAVIKSREEMSTEVIKGIKAGDFSIIYMSPETLLNYDLWGDMILNSEVYKERVCLIAIDEAHILESWGDTFRPTFARLGELRSHFPDVPYLLLTATCTQQVLQHITAKIHLPRLKLFTASPDRPEIYLEYKRSREIFEELNWLFSEIKIKGTKTRKTLIYVRSLSRGGNLYRDILGYLREHAYLEQRGFHNSHIALYHAGMASKDQDYILHEFSKPESVIRLVICTIAFGLGISIPDIEVVIHWGACDSIMDYWQEVGRAGRDGRKAKALYYVTPGSLLQASDEMKELCKKMDKSQVKCFRESILRHFIGYSSLAPQVPECHLKCTDCDCPRCRCCHLCSNTCPCHNDSKL